MATIHHSLWMPSPGLSLMMSSSLGSTMLDQGMDYGVAGVEGMLYGETLAGAEEEDPWVRFIQESFIRHTGRPRRRRE